MNTRDVYRQMRVLRTKEKTNRNMLLSFRPTEETKAKAEALRSLMQVASTSEIFRTLLNDKAAELSIE